MNVLYTPPFSKIEEKEFCDTSTNLSWQAKTYYKPIEKNFTFDSFYYDDKTNTLIGFQITTDGKKSFDVSKVVDK